MPIELQNSLRKLQILSILSSVCQFSIVGIAIVSIALAVCKQSVILGIAAAATWIIPISVLYWMHRSEKAHQKECTSPWRIPADIRSAEQAVQALRAEKIAEHAWVSFLEFHGIQMRILIQAAETFDQRRMQSERKRANSAINKRWQVPSAEPLSQVSRKIRVHCVICENATPELEAWIQHDAIHLLYRNECILNLALIPSKKELWIPSFWEILDGSQIRRVCAAVAFFCERFPFDNGQGA